MQIVELPVNITGNTLKAMREGSGLSLRTLATGLGCSHQHLHSIENGQRPLTPKMAAEVAQIIADHLSGKC